MTTRRAREETGGCARSANENAMKLVFWSYLVVIASGLVYFSVIGLTHH